MPLILAAALAVAPTLPACSWDRPGHNPFMGDVVAAVDRYPDIPAATRARLKARMAARQYDEIATIRRDGIEGRARYAPEIRDMHFGQGQVCGTVTRARWTPQMQERGLVYCEDGQCILVPTVCRNVSRIQRLAPASTAAPTSPGQPPAGGGQAAGGAGDDPAAAMAATLDTAPPGAGIQAPTGPGAAAPGSFAAVAGLAAMAAGDAAGHQAGEAAGPPLAGGVLSPGGGDGGVGQGDTGSSSGGWGVADGPWLGPITGGGGWAAAEPGRGTAAPGAGGAGGAAEADGPVDVGRLGPGDVRELVPSAPTVLPPGELPLLVAQAVPEPGSAGLLAAGLAGLVAWRRRKLRS